jgi:ribosome biogenesis SPOUT family RNA methylase Rps3
MKEIRILGINVTDRIKDAGATQKIMSEYAKCIKTRLGFHELSEDKCSRNAFIIIEMTENQHEWDNFEDKLKLIPGVIVKKMSFFY